MVKLVEDLEGVGSVVEDLVEVDSVGVDLVVLVFYGNNPNPKNHQQILQYCDLLYIKYNYR
mgnify:CR=1 FL=1